MVSLDYKKHASEILRDAADSIDKLGSLPFKHETDSLINQIFQVQRMLANMAETSNY